MTFDEKYMYRCLQLAANGKGRVSPNPMVGAVIVYEDKIIGEGYHQEYGKAHAEVNALNSVKDRSLLNKSTMYVSLEPCSHYGKTPPCAQLIIDSKIPKVVIATLDPYPKVSGRGVKMLQEAGVEVIINVLEQEARELNKEFIVYNVNKRPYIYIKWAQSRDGYIDKNRPCDLSEKPVSISNSLTHLLVHKLRTEVDGIMVGTNTAIKDNPSLSARLWYGKSPVRIVLDRTGRIPHDYNIFDNTIKTYLFTERVHEEIIEGNTVYVPLCFDDNMYSNLINYLYKMNLHSILIEGGANVLQNFIDNNIWDEAFIETSNQDLSYGVKAPVLQGKLLINSMLSGSDCRVLKNIHNYKIL